MSAFCQPLMKALKRPTGKMVWPPSTALWTLFQFQQSDIYSNKVLFSPISSVSSRDRKQSHWRRIHCYAQESFQNLLSQLSAYNYLFYVLIKLKDASWLTEELSLLPPGVAIIQEHVQSLWLADQYKIEDLLAGKQCYTFIWQAM